MIKIKVEFNPILYQQITIMNHFDWENIGE